MRHSAAFVLICAALVCSHFETATQTLLPDCANVCYSTPSIDRAPCTFSHNDCTCGTSIASKSIQICTLKNCSVKEWLVTMNATNHVCDRQERNGGNVVILCAAVLGSLAIIAISMRIFVAFRQKRFQYDDLFACLAACMSIPHSFGMAMSAKLGFGRDTWTLTPFEITRIQKIIHISQNFYFWCLGFQKLCFLFFFLRIFPSENARRWCYVGIVLSIGYAAGFGLTLTFACWPISAAWTSWTMEKRPVYCINQNLFYYCAAAVNIASDLMIALIPIPQLWRLNLTLMKKLQLLAIFGVGFVIITISCLRMRTLEGCSSTVNPAYDTLANVTWSNVELNVGVICTCMPIFCRFLTYTVPRCFGTVDESQALHGDVQFHANPFLNGKKRSKKRSTLPDSLFATTIVKTIDTQIVSAKKGDDELHLVEMGASKSATGSGVSISQTPVEMERSYRAQNHATLPKQW